ncbi:LacI family DNA-binding transcriptional regulator [Dongia sedimenti]|uniref:LacI family DNA-binding transcriptional regulator n=1 Tax=Dongia sedimenti TaxID=3064282 RepID=A0ABU0YVB1_9PROT|nr:LacI family DNA-binding transcriptional regulator [Rhodospirillaceae bacterium R-7]
MVTRRVAARRSQSMITISEVARAAGVSISTVAHVVNGTRDVAPDTAQLVNDAIARIGYQPNDTARYLEVESTRTVGLAISTLSNPYFGDITGAVEAECARLGLMVFLADTQDDPEKELTVIHVLHRRRVDGIIFAPSPEPIQALDYLMNSGLPCVLLDRMADRRFDQVGVDNVNAMDVLVEHVVLKGHRDIAFVAGQPGFATTIERIAGFQAALASRGIELPADRIVTGCGTTAVAAEAACRLLTGPQRPSAIVTGNNLSTIGVMRAMRELGLTVPDDVSLVGFDDFEWADLFEPRLTLLEQPCTELGRQAAALLIQRIAEPTGQRRTLRLPTTLKVRASCRKLG